jgi:hypothetical protein
MTRSPCIYTPYSAPKYPAVPGPAEGAAPYQIFKRAGVNSDRAQDGRFKLNIAAPLARIGKGT